MPYKVRTVSVRGTTPGSAKVKERSWNVKSAQDKTTKPKSKAKSKAIRKMQAASRKRLHKIHLRKVIFERRLKLAKGKKEGNIFLRPLET